MLNEWYPAGSTILAGSVNFEEVKQLEEVVCGVRSAFASQARSQFSAALLSKAPLHTHTPAATILYPRAWRQTIMD